MDERSKSVYDENLPLYTLNFKSFRDFRQNFMATMKLHAKAYRGHTKFTPQYWLYRRVKDDWTNLALFYRFLETNLPRAKFEREKIIGFRLLILWDPSTHTDCAIRVRSSEEETVKNFLLKIYGRKRVTRHECQQVRERWILNFSKK